MMIRRTLRHEWANDDTEKYRSFLAGESAALDPVIIRYSRELMRYLKAILQNDQDAEDLTVEAFARIIARRPAIREGGFKAYLFRTARNLAFRHLSRQQKHRMLSLDEIVLVDPRTPDELAAGKEQKQILCRCLNQLEPLAREALWLVYRDGMSYAETAKVLGISVKKVDNLLSKGKRLLRQELEKEGEARRGEKQP